jgi:hypothetical protein
MVSNILSEIQNDIAEKHFTRAPRQCIYKKI